MIWGKECERVHGIFGGEPEVDDLETTILARLATLAGGGVMVHQWLAELVRGIDIPEGAFAQVGGGRGGCAVAQYLAAPATLLTQMGRVAESGPIVAAAAVWFVWRGGGGYHPHLLDPYSH